MRSFSFKANPTLGENLNDKVLVVDTHKARTTVHRTVQQVAVGVLMRQEHPHASLQFLMTTRSQGRVYEGYWEFAGGKIEQGETVAQALQRELKEELAIGVRSHDIQPWRILTVDYPHSLVQLNICLIRRYQGVLQALENQEMCWTPLPTHLTPILPGAVPILDSLMQLSGTDKP